MKITDIKLSEPWYVHGKQSTDATVVNPGIRATSLLEITTDEGISGFTAVGELNIGPQSGSLKNVLVDHAFKPLVVGEDPLDTERIWDKMYWGSVRWGRRGVALAVMGSIDIALWDLKGKILGQPVHKLLGGHRDTVAAYGSSVSLHASEDELVAIYSGYVEAGFKMVKMKVGMRDSNVDLALDVNSGWSLNAALRMCDRLEPYNIYWLEEPLPPDEIDNHVKLARETSIPIALGETHATKWEFKELMEREAIDIVQADIVRCGGVTEWVKIAAIADAYGLPMCPHATTELAASLVAAVPNGLFVECFKTSADKKGTSPFVDPILPKNGEISPNDKPGFGIEIDDEILAKLQAGPKPDPEELRFATTRGWQWPPYL